MAEAEGPDGRRVVVADAALLGVEAHALADDGRPRARRAPDGEGHLEAHREGAVRGELGGARAEGVFAVQAVARRGALDVGRDVASHVEALHDGRFGWEEDEGEDEGDEGDDDEFSQYIVRGRWASGLKGREVVKVESADGSWWLLFYSS